MTDRRGHYAQQQRAVEDVKPLGDKVSVKDERGMVRLG